jgi:hypothetical protein
VGYTVGVPLFDSDQNFKQVVVTSRPIITLGALHEDFEVFLGPFWQMFGSYLISRKGRFHLRPFQFITQY